MRRQAAGEPSDLRVADAMPLDDLRSSDLDRAEAALTRASAALRSSETDFDAAAALAAIWNQGMQRARRWGVVHLRAGREIGEWWHRVKRRRGRPKLGNSPIFPTSTQLADKLGVDRRDITGSRSWHRSRQTSSRNTCWKPMHRAIPAVSLAPKLKLRLGLAQRTRSTQSSC